ncbi:MAG: helix-turn-helix domain-containing protein [Limisphaera sp.]
MASVGEQLRARREAMGLSLQDLATITKIRADHLRALEEGRYAVFSAPVYIKGSVRSCAQALKLDPAPLLRQLDQELSQDAKLGHPPALSPAEPGFWDRLLFHLVRLSWRQTAIMALLVVLAAVWLGRYLLWERRPAGAGPQSVQPTLYQEPVPPHLETLSLPAPQPTRPAG